MPWPFNTLLYYLLQISSYLMYPLYRESREEKKGEKKEGYRDGEGKSGRGKKSMHREEVITRRR